MASAVREFAGTRFTRAVNAMSGSAVGSHGYNPLTLFAAGRGDGRHHAVAAHGLLDAGVGVSTPRICAGVPPSQQQLSSLQAPGRAPSQTASDARRQRELRAAQSEAAVAMYRLLDPATRLFEPRDHERQAAAGQAERGSWRASSLPEAPSWAALPRASAAMAAEDDLRQQRSLPMVPSSPSRTTGSTTGSNQSNVIMIFSECPL